MTEAVQFVKWIARKMFGRLISAPSRIHQGFAREFRDAGIPFGIFIFGMVMMSGILLGMVVKAIGNEQGAVYTIIAWWTFAGAFVLSAMIRAMYWAFKREREALVKALKEEYEF